MSNGFNPEHIKLEIGVLRQALVNIDRMKETPGWQAYNETLKSTQMDWEEKSRIMDITSQQRDWIAGYLTGLYFNLNIEDTIKQDIEEKEGILGEIYKSKHQ